MDPNSQTIYSKAKVEKTDKLNFYYKQFLGNYQEELGKEFEQICKDNASYGIQLKCAGIFYDDPGTAKDKNKCRACIGFVANDDEKLQNQDKLTKVLNEKAFIEKALPESIAGRITLTNTNPEKIPDIKGGYTKLFAFMINLGSLFGKKEDSWSGEWACFEIYPSYNQYEISVPLENFKDFTLFIS